MGNTPHQPTEPTMTTTASRNHIRAMWNLMTDLMIEGRHQDAKAIREAIRIAEAAELDSGRF